MADIDYEDALFQSISTLIHEQRKASQRERREIERQPYRCIQLVAAYDGNRLPEQHEFRQVLCHDLSPQGFSFLVSQRPTEEQLIVALGTVPFKFLVAEIVRAVAVEVAGQFEYQIGCRFLRRIAER
jgi:hypothetical protein